MKSTPFLTLSLIIMIFVSALLYAAAMTYERRLKKANEDVEFFINLSKSAYEIDRMQDSAIKNCECPYVPEKFKK